MISIPLLNTPVSVDSKFSNISVNVCHIEKEPVIKIHLHHSLTKLEVIYKDEERIVLRASTKTNSDDTIFIITRNYIVELRNVINVYMLKNYETLDLDRLKISVDMETEYYNDDYDTQFYLKIQTE